MSDIAKSLQNIKVLDTLARRHSSIHRLHAVAKLATAVAFIGALASFDRYEVVRLLPFVFYPVVLFAASRVPVGVVARRILYVLPLILFIGVFNPIFDQRLFMVGGQAITGGWLTFASLVLKSVFSVAAALLLMATTGMDGIACALRTLRVPRIFVLQLVLTYRYIGVLLEEAGRSYRAYRLRAPGQKGIHPRAWGSFAGMLLLRTFERARRVYDAMLCRRFDGEYHTGRAERFRVQDASWTVLWTAAFVLFRIYDIPALLGRLLSGVMG